MRLVGVVLATGLLGGCAFTEGQIPVHYVAPPNLEVTDGANTVSVTVKAHDGRVSNRDRIGTKKNGYGMEAARITAKNDIVELVRGAVEQELESLGFKVGPGGLTVNVELEVFYNDFKASLFHLDAVAEVAFSVTALNPDGSIAYSKSYRAVGTNQDIFMATPESAEPALEQALTHAMAGLVQDDNLQKSLVTAGHKLAGAPELPHPATTVSPAIAAAVPPPSASRKHGARGPLPSSVEFEAPSVGTRIYTDRGGQYEITSVEGTVVKTMNAASHSATWVGGFFSPGSESEMFNWRDVEGIWPLEVGKTVPFELSGSLGAWHVTMKVLRQEEITTEAGRFQTVVVETRERSVTGASEIVHTQWYAPEVGFIVKYSRETVRGASRPEAWTVRRVTRPDSHAVADAARRPAAVDFKAPPIGTRVYLDTGGYLQVAAVDGKTIHTVNADSREADYVGSLYSPGNAANRFDRSLVESIWPLEIGKSVRFEISRTDPDGRKRAWEETITVLREEHITTEAGPFRTVVVELRQRSLTGVFESITTRWYAPDIGFIVKYRHTIEKGSGTAGAWSAAKIEKPGS
ncbi:MAG TPA: YajG family lipoprotein [Alphaproteobacteria bacterium]|nr:YajG family lipoprotein [Alphaproteobacteria bacterium]